MPRLTEAEIVAAIHAAFPEIAAQVYRDSKGRIRQISIGSGGGHPVMQDGHPVFADGEPDGEIFYGGVNRIFIRWIAERGWYPELSSDGFTCVLTAAPSAEQAAADRAEFIAWLKARAVNRDDWEFAIWFESGAYAKPAGAADVERHRRLSREVRTYIEETRP
ncbi:Uncharacterised protein [Burkholderia pseudomallei]|nr:Uncharacterised protein [Burkholderia pseudomallei]CAJ5392594.1 Uncharacterised protein [Burkholderia pseudomallei]CAJ7342874.1 Uncharacterised protein [Burkholderia pseudomallei]